MYVPFPYILPLLLYKYTSGYNDWTPPPHHQRIPQDVMVDVVNNLGIKLLQIHNLNNENNIAISPYGALSVLVVLGEGLQGEAAHEILHAARIPPDLSLIRIGLRDIHRHLKSYFIPEEGFLAGMTLNEENVTLRDGYKEVLEFYGYDLNSFNNALYPGYYTTDDSVSITQNYKPVKTTTEKSDNNSEVEDITTLSTTLKNEEMTLLSTTSMKKLEDTSEKSTIEVESTTLSVSTTTEEPIKTTMSTTITTVTSTESSTLDPVTMTEVKEMTTSSQSETTSVSSTTTTETTTSLMELTTDSENSTSSEEVRKRNVRSITDYLIVRFHDQYPLISYSSLHPEVPSFLINGKYREPNISFMMYDTVLPFYFVGHLNTLALSFPLDNPRYYLLLLLPLNELGIDQLICNLAKTDNTLKYIIEKLRFARVKAIIPSFMLKGFVVLTSTFQKLGIRKIFEPRQADFSLMTNTTGIYVTNIEQAITVTIRNYIDPLTTDAHNRFLLHYDPVHFKADHPFLYFVIDAELHVSLMAGKVVNPLNSRI